MPAPQQERGRVRRFPQHFAEDRWEEDGFASLEDCRAWSERACGLACVRMVLAYYGLPVPEQSDLLWQGLELGAYCDRGWIHHGLVELGERHGLTGRAIAAPTVDDLTESLVVGLPIVSVTWKFPTDGHRGGHLVLFTGEDRSAEGGPVVRFAEPSRWGADNDGVPRSRFEASYTGRAILFAPASGRQRFFASIR